MSFSSTHTTADNDSKPLGAFLIAVTGAAFFAAIFFETFRPIGEPDRNTAFLAAGLTYACIYFAYRALFKVMAEWMILLLVCFTGIWVWLLLPVWLAWTVTGLAMLVVVVVLIFVIFALLLDNEDEIDDLYLS